MILKTLFCLLLSTCALQSDTYKVTSATDSGPGSLRETVGRCSDGDTILFSSEITTPIILTTGEIALSKDLTITGPGITVSGNQSSALFYINSDTTVILNGLTLTESGSSAIKNRGQLSLTQSTFTKNSGALCSSIDNSGVVILQECTISDNDVRAIYNYDGVVSVTNCSFTDNLGGAVINYSGMMAITNSVFSGNSTTAIYNNGGTLRVANCTLVANSGNNGGAIYNGGVSTVTNSTLAANRSAKAGGAIYNDCGMLEVVNCTLTNNSSNENGGAIYSEYTYYDGWKNLNTSLKNSIVAGNQALNLGPDIYGEIISNGYNFIGNPSRTNPKPSDLTFANTQTTLDQLLQTTRGVAVLADNGGPTQTIALVAGSPALRAGNTLDAPVSPWDQRGAGFDRIVNGCVDMGAVEMRKLNI